MERKKVSERRVIQIFNKRFHHKKIRKIIFEWLKDIDSWFKSEKCLDPPACTRVEMGYFEDQGLVRKYIDNEL